MEVPGEDPSPLPCISVSEMIHKVTDRAYHDLRRLAHTLNRVNLDTRREDLLSYVRLNRARFIRAYTAVRWLEAGNAALVVNAKEALALAGSQRDRINECQDQFFFMHGALFGARQRVYDVPTAVDVLVGAGYSRMPKAISFCGADIDPEPLMQVPAVAAETLPRVERAIRQGLLLREPLPPGFTSHILRKGVLTLIVEGKFELSVTMEGEEEDTGWTLVGWRMKVKARAGEAITEPVTDRQQRYLHHVVQKVLDVHSEKDEEGAGSGGSGGAMDTLRGRPLLAAYELCHSFCSSIVMEVLHAQAEALASRVGGLWANQLRVDYDPGAQVLDLCIWYREYHTGLGGTGKDVGVGATDAVQAVRSGTEEDDGASVNGARPPRDCRYLRIYKAGDRSGEVMVSLGPFTDLGTSGGDWGSARDKHLVTGGRVEGALTIQTDALSCGEALLSAARAFAAGKIKALAVELESLVADPFSRHCCVDVFVVRDLTVCVCPSQGSFLEVSVDSRSGRYMVRSPGCGSPAMERCLLRLQEALNLVPNRDLGARITAALADSRAVASAASPGGSQSSATSARGAGGRGGATVPGQGRQGLREAQVQRCLSDALGLLTLEQAEKTLRCSFGLVPHRRWEAILGLMTSLSTGPGDAGSAVQAGAGRALRTYARLCEFEETGVLVRGAPRQALAPSARQHAGKGASAGAAPSMGWGEVSDTSEAVMYFLEVGATAGQALQTSLLTAAVPCGPALLGGTAAEQHSMRPAVVDVRQIAPRQGRADQACRSTEAPGASVLGKRPLGGTCGPDGVGDREDRGAPPSCPQPGKVGLNAQLEPMGVNGLGDVPQPKARCINGSSPPEPPGAVSPLAPASDVDGQLKAAIQACNRLIPYLRVQRALSLTGSTLAVDLAASDGSGAPPDVPVWRHVSLVPGGGWSAAPVSVRAAWVRHTPCNGRANSWEWRFDLGPGTGLEPLPPALSFCAASSGGAAAAAAMVQQHVPLVTEVTVADGRGAPPLSLGMNGTMGQSQVPGERGVGDLVGMGRARALHVYFSDRSVHAMSLVVGQHLCQGLRDMAVLTRQVHAPVSSPPARDKHARGGGYRVVGVGYHAIALHHEGIDHVVLVTHSAFSAGRTGSNWVEPPGLILIPGDNVLTCPATMQEPQAILRKHQDLARLIQSLSLVVPPVADSVRR